MMILNYESKKELKESIGKHLKYTETSFFGDEYKSKGTFIGCNRPSLTEGTGTREFFATVTVWNDVITKVK